MTDHSQVIPAQPGYYIVLTVDLVETQGTIEFTKIPIVAWVVSYKEGGKDYYIEWPFAVPVTFEGTAHAQDPLDGLIIMDPNGAVHEPFFGWWDSFEEYKQYAREKHERENQKPESFD